MHKNSSTNNGGIQAIQHCIVGCLPVIHTRNYNECVKHCSQQLLKNAKGVESWRKKSACRMTNLVDGYKSTTKIMASTDLCLQSLNFHCMKLSLLNLRKDNCLTLNSCVKIFDPNPLLPPPQNIALGNLI